MTITLPTELAERTEINSYADFALCAPTSVRDELGVATRRIGNALALVVRGEESCYFNRAAGFGAGEPITVDVIARACDFFREQDVPEGSIMIAPGALPDDWAAIATELKLSEGDRYVKVACTVEQALAGPDATLDPKLRVGVVEPHLAREWATVMMTTFEMPALVDVAEAFVTRDSADWQHFAVWEDERIVGVGSLHVVGECANMFGGATLPQARNRGAQSARIAWCTRAAQAAGCTWLVADTGAEGPGEHNPSLHNMLRRGLERQYERVSWVWRR